MYARPHLKAISLSFMRKEIARRQVAKISFRRQTREEAETAIQEDLNLKSLSWEFLPHPDGGVMAFGRPQSVVEKLHISRLIESVTKGQKGAPTPRHENLTKLHASWKRKNGQDVFAI